MTKKPKSLPADVSLADLCWLLGCSKQRVAQLESAGIVEKTARDKYALTSLPRVFRFQREGGAAAQPLQDARAELIRERVAGARMTRLEREGRTLSIEELRATLLSVLVPLKRRAERLPTKLAPAIFGQRSVPAVQLILDREIRDWMTEIASADFFDEFDELADESGVVHVDVKELRHGNRSSGDAIPARARRTR